jgi:MYXO-CTERM domain-containing protein
MPLCARWRTRWEGHSHTVKIEGYLQPRGGLAGAAGNTVFCTVCRKSFRVEGAYPRHALCCQGRARRTPARRRAASINLDRFERHTMQIHKTLAAIALAVAAVASHAENINQGVTLVPNVAAPGTFSAGWGVTHSFAGAFTDVFSFTSGVSGNVASSLVTIGFLSTTDIDFNSVSINGAAYSITDLGSVDLASFGPQFVNSPMVLTVTGIAAPSLAAGTAIAASYAGTLNVSPVPEPSSAALWMAGLGAGGLLVRRRLNRRDLTT